MLPKPSACRRRWRGEKASARGDLGGGRGKTRATPLRLMSCNLLERPRDDLKCMFKRVRVRKNRLKRLPWTSALAAEFSLLRRLLGCRWMANSLSAVRDLKASLPPLGTSGKAPNAVLSRRDQHRAGRWRLEQPVGGTDGTCSSPERNLCYLAPLFETSLNFRRT